MKVTYRQTVNKRGDRLMLDMLKDKADNVTRD